MAEATASDLVSPVGTTVLVAPGYPATIDTAGYATLQATATKVGLLEDFTPSESTTPTDDFEDLERGKMIKVPGTRDQSPLSFITAHAPADDGQAILIDYHKGANKNKVVSLFFVDSDGAVTNYSGKVTGYSFVKKPLSRATFTVAVDEMVESPAPVIP